MINTKAPKIGVLIATNVDDFLEVNSETRAHKAFKYQTTSRLWKWRILLGSEFALLLEIVGDGKWHELTNLQQKARLTEQTVQSITVFLSNFGFVEIDETKSKLKIRKDFQELLARTWYKFVAYEVI